MPNISDIPCESIGGILSAALAGDCSFGSMNFSHPSMGNITISFNEDTCRQLQARVGQCTAQNNQVEISQNLDYLPPGTSSTVSRIMQELKANPKVRQTNLLSSGRTKWVILALAVVIISGFTIFKLRHQ